MKGFRGFGGSELGIGHCQGSTAVKRRLFSGSDCHGQAEGSCKLKLF